jgi:hypothetical protein
MKVIILEVPEMGLKEKLDCKEFRHKIKDGVVQIIKNGVDIFNFSTQYKFALQVVDLPDAPDPQAKQATPVEPPVSQVVEEKSNG